MAERVTLTVDGEEHGGWTAVEVARSLETAAGAFTLELTERWPGQPERRRIATGAACSLAIGGETVITGHVDDVQYGFDAGSHGVTVRGRDRAGDLVDCSVVEGPKSWRGRTVAAIAADIARPFGVTVEPLVSAAALPEFTIQEGETAWEAIERACRLRGLLAVSDGRGGLQLTRAGGERVSPALEQGANILAAVAEHSLRERYSRYLVKGQQAGSDEIFGEAAAAPSGAAQDPDVPRYRPLLVMAEDQGDGASLRARARWEAAVRAGRGQRARVTVQGWRHGGAAPGAAGGGLWAPNQLATLRSDWLSIDRELLVVAVAFTLSEAGSTCDLTLARPEAFEPEPLAASGEGGGVDRLAELVRAARRQPEATP